MIGALEGIRVVEFGMGNVMPGLVRILADLGAEVIKVESRYNPDFMRMVGEVTDKLNQSMGFNHSSRNKKSLTLNLKSPKAIELAKRLVAVSDVVAENFAGGVLKRLGLGYEELRQVKPDLIYLSTPGMGSSGPRANYRIMGPNLPALGGLTYLWNHPGSDMPIGSQIIHPDYYASIFFAMPLLAALDYRRRTGKGMYIDGAQVELMPAELGPQFLEYTVNGRMPEPIGNRGRGAPGGVYRCQGEDKWCAITVETEEEWVSFCEAIGKPDLREDVRFATALGRTKNAGELDRIVESWTIERTNKDVMHTLQKSGVPAGACYSAPDLYEDPQVAERGLIVEIDHPEVGRKQYTGFPVKLSETPATFRTPAPCLAQHNVEICRELLGMTEEEIQQLTEERVIY